MLKQLNTLSGARSKINLRVPGGRRKKSRFPQIWSWLFHLLSIPLLVGCIVSKNVVNDPEGPRVNTPPPPAQSLPSEWTATPQFRFSAGEELSNPSALTSSDATELAANEPLIIGKSIEGRPLEIYQFGNGSRNLMIVAGIHGGYEWNTIALAEELIAHLSRNPDAIPEKISLNILRALNPDGAALERGPLGRGNANAVDLNRNWNRDWQSELPKGGCWNLVQLTGGRFPGSEPETKALRTFIIQEDIAALISYHSAGLGIFAGGFPENKISVGLAQAVASVSTYPYPPILGNCHYTGTMADWAANAGIPTVEIELSTHGTTDFEQNLRILEVFLHWVP
ncbi:MAG: hypothetical protein IIC78_04015 [Chloroflexi bacterium]|nr:hypothetical protein [Chloroflexota bacterium]